MGSVTKVDTGWRARWRTPDGASRSKTFARKTDATAHVAAMEADKLRGSYVDPRAGAILFGTYAEQWLAAQTFDEASRLVVERRLRLHAFPALGNRQLRQLKPSTIQAWLRDLEPLAPNHRSAVFVHVSSVLNAAVDDELITKNPCRASSVRRPRPVQSKIEPWPIEQVWRVADALPERYRIVVVLGAGLGMRQGEIVALSPTDVDFLRGSVEVRRQIKGFGPATRRAFALPKGGKTRTVPLPDLVRDELAAHLATFPARPVTLPWGTPEGERVTVDVVVTMPAGGHMFGSTFNDKYWKPALRAAGVPLTRQNGCHALRHHYASVLLDGGESIKALSAYLGHADPGFTLRTYTHLMPSSEDRTRRVIDRAWSRVTGVSAEAG